MAGHLRILVVDDEPAITELIGMALTYEGYDVRTCADGRTALALVRDFRPHLVVLDVMLQGPDGFEVLAQLRDTRTSTPVVFLTARSDVGDRVHALRTLAADDYVTKPFSVAELIARVEAVLRRSGAVGRDPAPRHTFADLELDEAAREVHRAGTLIHLTLTEYRLLRYLLVNAGTVLTRQQIYDHVWQYDFGGDASTLETYISYVRRKVEITGVNLIHTVRGVGYVLRLPRP